MGDKFLSMLKLFQNCNLILNREVIKECIATARYELDVVYYRGVGIMSGTIGNFKVIISYNHFENPNVFSLVVDGKQASGNLTIDVIDTFSKTGQLLEGIKLVPTIEELVTLNIADNENVHPSRQENDTHIVIVYPNRKMDASVTALYCTSHDVAIGVRGSFMQEGYMTEMFELNSGVIELFLKWMS